MSYAGPGYLFLRGFSFGLVFFFFHVSFTSWKSWSGTADVVWAFDDLLGFVCESLKKREREKGGGREKTPNYCANHSRAHLDPDASATRPGTAGHGSTK